MAPKNVPAAELDVLVCLQRLGQATVSDIREGIRSYRPMAHGSAVNLLKRLEAKSLVTKQKGPVGKAFVYRPTRQAGSVHQHLLGRLVHRVFGGDSMALVASLFESKPPDREQIARLEQLLAELKKK
jgi:BlaI family transcriptional regulator, penicillinase repressor